MQTDLNRDWTNKTKKRCLFSLFSKTTWTNSDAYSEPCQVSKVEVFVKIVYRFMSSIIFVKISILDAWMGFEYTSDVFEKLQTIRSGSHYRQGSHCNNPITRVIPLFVVSKSSVD